MQDMVLLLETGLGHHRGGQAAQAAACYRGVLEAAPEQPSALYLLGLLLAGEDCHADEALVLLTQAARLRPQDSECRVALGCLCHRMGNQPAAAEWWRDSLAINAGHAASACNVADMLRRDGQWREAAEVLRTAVAHSPGHGRLWVRLASALLAGGLHASALEAAEASATLLPDEAEPLVLAGIALGRLRRWQDAVDALARAARLAPGNGWAALQHGNALIDLDRWAEAETELRRAVALDPGCAEAQSSLGHLLYCCGLMEESLARHDVAVALQPQSADMHCNRAACLIATGDFTRGFAAYEWRKRNDIHSCSYWRCEQAEWRGEDLSDRTLLVFCEQGNGDIIFCARFLPVLADRGAHIVLVCPPDLHELLRDMPGVMAMVARDHPRSRRRVMPGEHVPNYDFWIDQMSLPFVLGTTVDTVPGAGGYLQGDGARMAEFVRGLPDGRRVGLVWKGNPEHSNDRRRSMDLTTLAPLLREPDCVFVSLQLGHRHTDLSACGIYDAAPFMTNYADSASLLTHLDLTVSVDTSVAHLAGALGRPVWLMLPAAAEWRWMKGTDTPWYRSMRLFRQTVPGDWRGVVQAVGDDMRAMHGCR